MFLFFSDLWMLLKMYKQIYVYEDIRRKNLKTKSWFDSICKEFAGSTRYKSKIGKTEIVK